MTGPLPTAPGADHPARTPAAPTAAARERVVELLQTRFAHDALSLDEFERRLTAAFQAPTTGELDALVADLSRTDVAADAVPEHGRIRTILSNNESSSVAAVPRHLEITALLGNVELDMRDAVFAPGVTEIVISATFSNVELTVPLGVRVEGSASTLFGSFDLHTGEMIGYNGGAERLVRITGRAIFSSVEVGIAAPTALLRQADAPRRLNEG